MAARWAGVALGDENLQLIIVMSQASSFRHRGGGPVGFVDANNVAYESGQAGLKLPLTDIAVEWAPRGGQA